MRAARGAFPHPPSCGNGLRKGYNRTMHVDVRQRDDVIIVDLQGRLVRSLVAEHRPAGPNSAAWNGLDDRGRRAASGVYLARLRAGAEMDLLKVTLVK